MKICLWWYGKTGGLIWESEEWDMDRGADAIWIKYQIRLIDRLTHGWSNWSTRICDLEFH